MRLHALLLAAALALAPLAASHSVPAGRTRGVAAARLAEAARRTPVSDIDYDQRRCDDRTVEQWLTALVGRHARRIDWTGGPCEITGPGIDRGSDWCAQATIVLARPKSRRDKPMIEVFFEKPARGRPGKAYAFRGSMQAADGPDMSRFRKDFEYDWTSRFPAPKGAIVDCPEA